MTIAESWQLDMEKPWAINGGTDKHSNGKPHSSVDQYHTGGSTKVFSLTLLTYFSCSGKQKASPCVAMRPSNRYK